MIDWRLASVVAQGVAATGPAPPAEGVAAFETPAELARECAEIVSAYTGLEPLSPLPAAEAVDRAGWIETSLAGMRGILDPVVARLGGAGPLGLGARAIGGGLLALEVGVISGVLAQRVLGQYEFSVLDPSGPARLLLVAPNLAHAARTLGGEPADLERWVVLHEVTHALQFGGVPWLREHLAARVGNLLEGLELTIDPSRLSKLPSADDLRGLVEAVRQGDLATAMLGDEQRAALEEMQAFMAVLEGYAEHVMDVLGEEQIADLPALRAAMDRRRRDRTGLLRLLERLIGLDMKLRQYELGKAFCDAVAERGGIEALNRVWESPDRMPTPAELEDPAAWLARTEPGELRAADA